MSKNSCPSNEVHQPRRIQGDRDETTAYGEFVLRSSKETLTKIVPPFEIRSERFPDVVVYLQSKKCYDKKRIYQSDGYVFFFLYFFFLLSFLLFLSSHLISSYLIPTLFSQHISSSFLASSLSNVLFSNSYNHKNIAI
jgi:hypothetical protein